MWKQSEDTSKDGNLNDGDGWLVNDEQELVCEFSADDSSTQVPWVTIRTFRWRKPDYPIPQARRRLPRDSAIVEWQAMQAAGSVEALEVLLLHERSHINWSSIV